ncbi:MAG TPA: GxxExxY protein [Gemmatimonadaceae bacterium]
MVEVKTVQQLVPVHEAQLLSYLRLARIERGLLINFHAYTLRDGIKRLSLSKTP